MKLEKVSQLLYQLKIVNQEMTAKFEKSTGYSINSLSTDDDFKM